MKIDWWTLALQAVNFLILIWLLSRFLFTPVKEVIEKRKVLVAKAFAKAKSSEEKARKAQTRYQEERAALEKERMALRKSMREEMEEERQALLKEAKQQASKIHSKAKEEISRNRLETLAGMRKEIVDLAADMATTLLKGSTAEDTNDFVLKSLTNQLGRLNEKKMQHLHKDPSLNSKGITVVTAAPLSSEQQKHWQTQIARSINKNPKFHFTTEPGLVGGAVLRFPHAELRFSWDEQLDDAKKLLLGNEREVDNAS